MPRNLSTPMSGAMTSNFIRPCFLAALTFRTQTIYCWSGVGNLSYASGALTATQITTTGGSDVLKTYIDIGTGVSGTVYYTSVSVYNNGAKTINVCDQFGNSYLVPPGITQTISWTSTSNGIAHIQIRFQSLLVGDALSFVYYNAYMGTTPLPTTGYVTYTLSGFSGATLTSTPSTWANTYLGVGDFGKIGRVTEGSDVQAYGTSISLSGIDPLLLSECLDDIQLGAPATIYFALLDNTGNIFGTPYPLFVGTVDQPSIQVGVKSLSISLGLENKLSNLQRPNMRRYTAADQQLYYPGDMGMNWVEILNDQALLWNTGTSNG